VQKAQGDLAGAMKSYRDSLAIRERLAQSDPGNTDWQRDVSVAYSKVGEVQVAQGDLAGAMKSDRDSFAIIEGLAQSDPGNADWQRDLSLLYVRVGDVQKAQGDLAGALKSYRDGLAIRERLAQSDPGNTDWQRDLSVSYERIGDVQVAQGDLAAALKSYRDGLSISQHLAFLDRSNKQWQNDLQIVIDRIGDLANRFVLARNFATALEAADQSISLAPDEIWLYANRAHALMFLGQIEEAKALYLKYRDQTDVQDGKSWKVVIHEDFAELRKAGLNNLLIDEIEKLFASAG